MKNIANFMLLLLFFSSLSFSIEILGCRSGREEWRCEIGKECVCVITENCTNGNILLYQTDITSLVCAPQIIDNIARINLTECGVEYYNTIKVIADCEEGISGEKTITIVPPAITTTTTTTSTTLSQTQNVTITCTPKEGYCGEGRAPCCSGLECCSDYICKESCEEKRGPNIDIWLVIIGAVSVLIVVGILFIVGTILS